MSSRSLKKHALCEGRSLKEMVVQRFRGALCVWYAMGTFNYRLPMMSLPGLMPRTYKIMVLVVNGKPDVRATWPKASPSYIL